MIEQTGQMFGGAHVIDVLRGGGSARIRERRQDELPCYGLGAHHAVDYWQAFIRQAVRDLLSN